MEHDVIAPTILGALVMVGVALALIDNYRKRRAKKVAEARAFVASAQAWKRLAVVATPVMLKAGEVAFYCSEARLHEPRTVRHYLSGSARVRLAKGLYIGGTKGRSISTQQWAQLGRGMLTVTNRRIVFEGGTENRSFPLEKVLSVKSSMNAVEISIEGRRQSIGFAVPNSLLLAAVVQICTRADPLNLSQTRLDITFED